jgi:hypothetical protein
MLFVTKYFTAAVGNFKLETDKFNEKRICGLQK